MPMRSVHRNSGTVILLAVCVMAVACSLLALLYLGTADSRALSELPSVAKADVDSSEDAVMGAILRQTSNTLITDMQGMTSTQVTTNATPWTTLLASVSGTLGLGSDPTISSAVNTNLGQPASPIVVNYGSGSQVTFGTPTLGIGQAFGFRTPARTINCPAYTAPLPALCYGVYSVSGSTSVGGRYTTMPYPSCGVGLKNPGDTLVARRIWWGAAVTYARTSNMTATTNPLNGASAHTQSYTSITHNYIVSCYEIPSQLPIQSEADLTVGGPTSATVSLSGKVYGRNLTVSSGTQGYIGKSSVTGTASSASWEAQSLNASNAAGRAFLTSGISDTDAFYCAPSATPTAWDWYSKPYTKCKVRVNVLSYSATTGAISVQVSVANAITPAQSDLPYMSITPTFVSSTYSRVSVSDTTGNFVRQTFMTMQLGTADRPLLAIDPISLLSANGITGAALANYNTWYIGYNIVTLPPTPNTTEIGVSLVNTNDLTAFTSGFSLVSRQVLFLLQNFNATTPYVSSSLFAPAVRFTSSAGMQPVITGGMTVGRSGTTTALTDPYAFNNSNGVPLTTAPKVNLSAMTNPQLLPPITRINWLFTIEKAQQ